MQKVTKEDIEDIITGVEYLRPKSAPTLTLCVMSLENGFTVVGESACAHPAAFDEAVGKKLAYEDAFRKVWAFEGYLLRQRMFIRNQASSGKGVPLSAFMGDEKLSSLKKSAE
jgi:hypothetical protein